MPRHTEKSGKSISTHLEWTPSLGGDEFRLRICGFLKGKNMRGQIGLLITSSA